jgi:hypothetical protein
LDEIDREIEATSNDVVNRTRGLIARTRLFFEGDHAFEVVIVALVRSKLARSPTLARPGSVRAGDVLSELVKQSDCRF